MRCRRHHHHTLPPSRQRRQSVMAVSTMPCASADDRTLQQSGHTTAMSEQGRAGDAREMHAGLIGQCVGCGCNVGRCGWRRSCVARPAQLLRQPLHRVGAARRPVTSSRPNGTLCEHGGESGNIARAHRAALVSTDILDTRDGPRPSRPPPPHTVCPGRGHRALLLYSLLTLFTRQSARADAASQYRAPRRY